MTAAKRPAVFLDRDGVINRAIVRNGKPFSPRALQAFQLMPGIKDAVNRLRRAGYFIAVATNQPDIGNGDVSAELVNAMHVNLKAKVNVDAVYCCPHAQTAGCDCRKPKSGLLLTAENEHNLDLNQSWMIGDRASDIVAGQRVGCRTIFINRHYREPPPHTTTATVFSLSAAVEYVIRHT